MQFRETYKCLSSQLHYNGSDMKYSTWMRKQPEHKAAFLYVNFFSAVQSAWYKKSSFKFIDEAEAVSLVLQYLQKNVAKIEHDRNRYKPSYIHTVCVNCMSILHWRKCDRERNEKETSLIFEHDGEEFEILSILPGTDDSEYEDPQVEYGVPDLEDVLCKLCDDKYAKLIYHLINPQMSLRRVSKKNVNYDCNPFSDVYVPQSEVPCMIENIRKIAKAYIVSYRPDLLSYLK